jgi:hypothetical protein
MRPSPASNKRPNSSIKYHVEKSAVEYPVIVNCIALSLKRKDIKN